MPQILEYFAEYRKSNHNYLITLVPDGPGSAPMIRIGVINPRIVRLIIIVRESTILAFSRIVSRDTYRSTDSHSLSPLVYPVIVTNIRSDRISFSDAADT